PEPQRSAEDPCVLGRHGRPAVSEENLSRPPVGADQVLEEPHADDRRALRVLPRHLSVDTDVVSERRVRALLFDGETAALELKVAVAIEVAQPGLNGRRIQDRVRDRAETRERVALTEMQPEGVVAGLACRRVEE